MKKLLFVGVLSFFIASANAQIDSIFHVKNPQRTFTLKPLNRINGSYYYGNKKLKSFSAFEIPFYELNDSLVNQHYKSYRTLTTIGNLINIAPAIFLLTGTGNRGFFMNNQNTFWIIYALSLGTSLGFSIAGNSHIKKAALRYNEALKEQRIGYWTIEPDDKTLGLAVRYRF